jgi:hypothetical protein
MEYVNEMKNQKLDETVWKEDPDIPFSDEAAEVIKLHPGDSVEGVLTDVFDSVKWPGKKIYKIKAKNDDVLKVLVGTTNLDRMMSTKKVGDLVKIERKEDIPRKTGNPLQIYKTYST